MRCGSRCVTAKDISLADNSKSRVNKQFYLSSDFIVAPVVSVDLIQQILRKRFRFLPLAFNFQLSTFNFSHILPAVFVSRTGLGDVAGPEDRSGRPTAAAGWLFGDGDGFCVVHGLGRRGNVEH